MNILFKKYTPDYKFYGTFKKKNANHKIVNYGVYVCVYIYSVMWRDGL